MKFLSRLILMCLCFELLVAPIKPEMAMITILKANAAESCSAGMSWSDAANRCLVNASTAQTQRNLEDCAKSADPKSCYEASANSAANGKNTTQLNSGDIQAMYKGNSFGLNAAKTAVYALPLMLFGYMMVKKKMFGKNKCLPPSTIAMLAASVVMLGGEVYGFIKHKSNLKKLDESRKKLLTPDATDNLDQKKVNATQMQSEAFQLLADEQASVESLAKAKKTFYAVAMSAYGVAAGIATYELLAIKAAKKAVGAAVATEVTRLSGLTSSNPSYAATITKITTAYKKLTADEVTKTSNEAKGVLEAKKSANGAALGAAIGASISGTDPVVLTLDQLNAAAVADAPAVTSAVNNYKNLLVKFECWQADPPVANDPLTKELNNAPIQDSPVNKVPNIEELSKPIPWNQNLNNNDAQVQIYQIRRAKTVDQVLTLTNEFEEMTAGKNYSSLDSQVNLGLNIDDEINPFFVSTFAEMTATQLEEKYSIPKKEDHSISETSIFNKLQSEIVISSAYAKVEALLAVLPVAGTLLANSNLLKGSKVKGGPDNTSATSTTNGAATTAPQAQSPVKQVGGAFEKFIKTPKFRIAFGAVLGTLTYFMVKEMGDQQKLAKARKETLLTLKGDFENTQGMRVCTPDERNDQTQPGCYCYTADGTRNTARSSSAVCQNMWNSVSLNGTSYLADTGDGTKVCITQSNQVDEKCSCRTSGTCLKASGFNISGISLGTLSSLGSGLSPISTVASGNGASLNTDAVINGAMKLREATDKILASKDMKNDNAIVKAAEKSLGNIANSNQGTLGSPSVRSTPSSLAGFDAKAALEDLQKEVESTKASTASTGTGFDMGQPSEPSLEFGLTEEEAAIQEQQVAEVLNQDMDLGNSDISTSNSNIFELLTHRYQRSGMRRLFDTEGKTQPDAPAETDVNK